MILKSLKLENIRSYKEQTIEFPLGTTLFEGDIGSGKSTILMAIEFALFGLGSERGNALLRLGAKRGSVTLRFEVDGEEYEVYRSLERKGRGVRQGADGYLKTKDGILRLSPSELKERVLEILNFNEPSDPKAKSVIYRYAIFTPQEEMKAILWMSPSARLQTLRKAFRIEDYKTAADNISLLLRLIREKITELRSKASDLEEKKNLLRQTKSDIAQKEKRLRQLRTEEAELKEELEKLKEELERLSGRKDELTKVVGEMPQLERQIEEKEREISELRREIGTLKGNIESRQSEIDKLRAMKPPTPKTKEELKAELENLRKLERKLRRAEALIDAKINDYESVLKSGVCPTCDRPADPREFEERVKKKREEKGEISEKVAECERRIKEVESLQDALNEYLDAQKRLKNLEELTRRDEEDVEKKEKRLRELASQVVEIRKRLEAARREIEELKRISEKIESVKRETEKLNGELTKVQGEISFTEAKISMLEQRARELSDEVKHKKRQRKEAEILEEYRIWLQDYFLPTLELIEKHVMVSINQEFNEHFRKWFGLLVEDPSKEARVDEDFTPIVEQDGYEQNLRYLSGGEKTSVALAYRLALNSIVQKVAAGMKSNLLILDEPTDGFSKEQLFKVRDILNEIQSPQIIIVSHERELESFADHIFRVERLQGVSRVFPLA